MSNDVKNYVKFVGTSPTHECTPNTDTVIRFLEHALYGQDVEADNYYKVRLEESGRYSFWTKSNPALTAIWALAEGSGAHIEAEFWSLDSSFVGSMVFKPAEIEVSEDCVCTTCKQPCGEHESHSD